MPPQELEKQWAAALNQAKQKTVKKQKVPKKVQAAEIKEKLDHLKTKIFQATIKGSQEEAIQVMNKIIELRAAQTILALERFKELFGEIDENVLNHEIEEYTKDCLELAATVDAMLGIKQETHG